MGLIQKFFRTVDSVEHVGGTAHEIDRILSELGQLYILRTQAARTGTHSDMTAISAKIDALKAKLNQL